MWVEPYNGGKLYRIRDMVNGKKVPIESGFPNKTTAENRLLRLKVEKMDGGLLATGADKKLLGVWVNEWWASHGKKVAHSTTRTEGGRIRKHIVSRIGHLPLKTFGPRDIREWLDQLMEPDDADYDPLGAKSILNIHGYLSMALDAAVAERLIRVNPCTVSDLPKWERAEPRFLTEGELARVIELTPAYWKPVVVFLAASGARISEALGLQWKNVDLLTGRITFATQLVDRDGTFVDAPLKTKYSRRTITVPPSVCQVLALLWSADRRDSDYVFRSQNGGPTRYAVVRRAWRNALEKTEFKGLGFHAFRHTLASQLIKRNKSLTSIQKRLGHSSIKVTSDLYGHLYPEVDESIAVAVEEILEGAHLAGIVEQATEEAERERSLQGQPWRPGAVPDSGDEREGSLPDRPWKPGEAGIRWGSDGESVGNSTLSSPDVPGIPGQRAKKNPSSSALSGV
ncbi:tyrosine-type recombinase/integrase [Glycomyces sp. NPDC048151]|uniref:tyrosine-type recombinase/integrase n=1 Tax=Glycomyces sp. NPDC048151 TaxID=3364002 RepID=UPI00371FF2FE